MYAERAGSAGVFVGSGGVHADVITGVNGGDTDGNACVLT